MFKKIIASVLATLMLLIVLPTKVLAEEEEDLPSSTEIVYHEISELDTLPISETYSYMDLVKILKEDGYSESQINELIKTPNLLLSYSSSSPIFVRYGLFRMNEFHYSGGYVLQARFSVGLEYSGSDSPDRIVSLGGAHIYTGAGANCIFSGDIFYQLNSGNSFYYNFYGNMYKAGYVNWGGGIKIGVGQNATIHGEIASGDHYIRNVSETETYYAAGLQP